MAVNLKIPPSAVQPTLYSFWGWKQGGNVKNWKKRWFVLSDSKLFYFVDQRSNSARDCIEINASTRINENPTLNDKGRFYLTIDSYNSQSAPAPSPAA